MVFSGTSSPRVKYMTVFRPGRATCSLTRETRENKDERDCCARVSVSSKFSMLRVIWAIMAEVDAPAIPPVSDLPRPGMFVETASVAAPPSASMASSCFRIACASATN